MTTDVPVRATRFFGRDEDLRIVRSLATDSRLVTLTGAGGCGKTSLAAAVVTELAPSYDGVCWADLAALTDPGLVPKAVGSALQLADRPGAEPLPWLANAIRDRRLLLAIDNCEHLVDACADLVDRLLRGCAHLLVIATSREPLGVEGETSYRVPSLALPVKSDRLQDVLRSPAAALFADRAAKARPGFAVTEDNAAAVVEICRRLDGIPLALELAAARIRMMTPIQIAAGLGDRFTLLTGGLRTAMPRQRTLEASVAWSYDLLGDDERWVLRQLSVFAGSFDLDAALAVCAPGLGDALDVLGRLVERSLVQVDDTRPLARYRLLETVRDYVLTRLADSAEAASARDRHLDVYLELAERSELELVGSGVIQALDTLDADVHNLRAAMDWATAGGQLEKALRMAGALWIYWFIRTRHDEALRRLSALLDVSQGAPKPLRYRVIMAMLLLSLANDMHGSHPLAAEAVAIAEEYGDDRMLAQAYAWLAQVQHLTNVAQDYALMDKALGCARRSADSASIGRSLQWYGTVLGLSGEAERGAAMLDESIELFRVTGNTLQLGWAVIWRGVVASTSGDLDGARRFVAEGYDLLVARHEETFTAFALGELGHLSLFHGDLDDAAAKAEQAMAIASVSVAPMIEGQTYAYLGLVAMARGDHQQALDLASKATAAMEASGAVINIGYTLALSGYAAVKLGARARARLDLVRGYDATVRIRPARARVLWALAHYYDAEESHVEAVEHAHASLRLAVEVHDTVCAVDCMETLAQLLVDDDPSVAARLIAAANTARESLLYVRFPSHVAEHDRAVQRLREALDDYDAVRAEGARLTLAEAAAYAARGRGPRQRPTTGWDSLTAMQRDVATLVAKGLSNPEIGAQLFISRNTVKTHLAQAFAKLGVANRSELAAAVTHLADRSHPGAG